MKTTADYTPEQSERFQRFMETFKGFNAYTVARAINKQTPGIDWRGCSKKNLAEDYAKAKVDGWTRMVDLDLSKAFDEALRIVEKR